MSRVSGLGFGISVGGVGVRGFFACRPNETEDDTNGIRITYLL